MKSDRENREAAFEETFAALHPRLLRYAHQSLDLDTAAEVAAQAMFVVWRKGADVGRDASDPALNGLAFKIVDGLVRNAKRATTRRQNLVARLIQRHPEGGDAHRDVAESVACSADAEATLAGLPTSDRQLINLLMAGLTTPDIAATLEISRGAVAMRLQRLRTRLDTAERLHESDETEEMAR